LLHHHGLADVERADGLGRFHAAREVDARLTVGLDAAIRAGDGKQAFHHLVRRHDLDAFGFDLADDRTQETVVAERACRGLHHHLQRAPIRTDLLQRRPPHLADEDELVRAEFAQDLLALGRGAEPAPGMRHAVERIRRGLTFQGKNEKRPSGLAAGLDHDAGQSAAAGDDGEPIQGLAGQWWGGRCCGSRRHG
jgi:hypothetical protein